MPIAAIPAYVPDRLLAEASPGLRFGLYLKLWDADWRIGDKNKRDGLLEVGKLTVSDQRLMQALMRRQQALASPLAASGALLRLEAVAVAPFTTGLGNEHPLENGFAFLNPYGLPYLPGSGVKGVVRQAARELASGEWEEANGWNRDESHPLKIGEEDIRLSLLDVLFGRETPSSESEHVRGALAFWDVIPQIAGGRLAVEVMTPHQTRYYQNGGTPHESGSPIPIPFLTVPPKSRFAFHVACDLAHLRRLTPALAENERWKSLIEAAFAHAFRWLGFGAKTAVGYGAFAAVGEAAGISHPPAIPEDAVAKPRAPASETPGEIWDGARLRYNPKNGTLAAIRSNKDSANALAPLGAELFTRLPADKQRDVLSGKYVRVAARVRGSDLIDIEIKP